MSFLDDYYWDGKELKKKDRTLSDLLLGLNSLQKIPPPAPPPLSLSNLFNRSTTSPPPLGNLFGLPRTLAKSPANMWERFNIFLSRLPLSAPQRQDALTKVTNIGNGLKSKYYALPATTTWVVGSYMKQTAISPPTDIDMLFILPNKDFSRFDSYSDNGQSALLQEIRNKLLVPFPKTEIKADGQAVSVPFASYNVEVVPCFNHKNGIFITADSTDGGKWKFTCPTEERRVLQESNLRSTGNTIRLIKMIKAWKTYCSVEIKSLVIELRSIYFLQKWPYYNKGSVYFDWMIRDFFDELLKYCNGTCTIPGLDEKINYGDLWKSKAETALARAKKACDYEYMKKPDLAVQEWKKIFGDRFPE